MKGVPRPIPPFIAFDTETNGNNYVDEETGAKPGEMKCACVYGEYKTSQKVHTVEETFYDRQELSDFFRDLGTRDTHAVSTQLVAYNLAYDMWYVFDNVDYSSMITSGTRIITARLNNGIQMMDLANHTGVGVKLEDWFTKLKLEDKGIVKTQNPQDMGLKELVDHCKMDVRATWEVAEYFKKIYASMGVGFKLTTSSVAMNLYKRGFLESKWWRIEDTTSKNPTINDLERLAYYGGRTEVFARGIHHVQSYDVNSMYVSVMRDELYPLPNGGFCTHFAPNRAGQFKHYFYGKDIKPNLMIVHCRVKAPKSRVMVLPFRSLSDGKLIFPWGEFNGWWTSPELKEALKYGYTIEKVYEFILYRKPVKLFKDYATFCYNNRLKAIADDGKGSAFDTIWKLMGNGLYGKFAQRNPTQSGFSDLPPLGGEGQMCVERDVYGKKVYIYASRDKEDGGETFPCISAFVTAYSRLKLLKYLKSHEDNVVYCDTDSVKYPDYDFEEDPKRERHYSSTELGDVKYEPENSGNYIFLKPKLYGSFDGDFPIQHDYDFLTPTGQVLIMDGNVWKIKGIGGKIGNIILDLNKMTITGGKRVPTKLRDSIRRNVAPNVWYDMEKTMTIIDDKRQWKGKDSDPLYVYEEEL
jgi:hypothetical protein